MIDRVDFGFVLAIESAIEGGSLSLLRGTDEIESRVGPSGVSRAEDLLADIHDLLESNNVRPRELGLIAASAGPGSFTGVRIGLATALGLARGSGARFASISSLKAVAAAVTERGRVMVCLPVGRGSAAIQSFVVGSEGASAALPPGVIPFESIPGALERDRNCRTLIYHSLVAASGRPSSIDVVGPNLASDIGRACALDPTVTEPLFLSKN